MMSFMTYLSLLLFPCWIQESLPLPFFFLFHVIVFTHGSTELIGIGRRHLEMAKNFFFREIVISKTVVTMFTRDNLQEFLNATVLETDRKFTAKLLVSQTVSLLRLFSKLLSLRKVSKHLSYVEELNDCLKYVQVPKTQRLLRGLRPTLAALRRASSCSFLREQFRKKRRGPLGRSL